MPSPNTIRNSPELIKEFRYHIGHLLSFTLTDLDCLRFLYARQCSIERSVQMALKWDEWRHQLLEALPRTTLRYSPNIILTSFYDYFFSHPQIDLLPCLHHGWDRDGRPILWVKLGFIQSKFNEILKYFSTDDLSQYHLVVQEMFEMRYDYMYTQHHKTVTNAVVVFDMTGFDRVTLDMDSVWLLKSWIHLEQNYYPERLHQLYIVNTPWYFSSLLGMFQPFIDKKTRKKIRVYQGDFLSSLAEHIDPEYIPVELGGRSTVPYHGSPPEQSGVSLQQIQTYVEHEFFDPESTRVTTREEEASLRAIQSLAAKASRQESSADAQTSIYYSPSSRPLALLSSLSRSPSSLGPGCHRNSEIHNKTVQYMSSVFAANIASVESLASHDEYIIDVEYDKKVRWQVRHRYSDFDKFRKVIQNILPTSARKTVPQLPPKVLFNRRAGKVMLERKQKLSAFLVFLLSQIRSEATFDGIKLSSRREEEHQMFLFLDAYKALQSYAEQVDFTSDEDSGDEGSGEREAVGGRVERETGAAAAGDDSSEEGDGCDNDLSFRDRDVRGRNMTLLLPPEPPGGPLDQILCTPNRRVSAALLSVCFLVLSLVGNVYRLQN